MLYLLFRLCCGFITLISMITGFSYEEVNTFLFIYVEPFILLATAMLIPIMGWKYLNNNFNKVVFGLSFIYILILMAVIIPLWQYYSQFTMQADCEQAYVDLEYLGKMTGLGYVNINLFLFIILFLAVLIFNITVVVIQKRIYKRNLNN